MFRSMLASQLVEKHGLSQAQVARKLGITQAAVSQYMHYKRAKPTRETKSIMRKAQKSARMVALRMSQNRISSDEVMKIACRLCAETA